MQMGSSGYFSFLLRRLAPSSPARYVFTKVLMNISARPPYKYTLLYAQIWEAYGAAKLQYAAGRLYAVICTYYEISREPFQTEFWYLHTLLLRG